MSQTNLPPKKRTLHMEENEIVAKRGKPRRVVDSASIFGEAQASSSLLKAPTPHPRKLMTTRASKKPVISTGMVQPKTKKQPGQKKLEKKRSGDKVVEKEKKEEEEEESSSADDAEDIFLLQKASSRKRGRPISSQAAAKESKLPPAKKRRALSRSSTKEEPISREGMRKAKALTETIKFVKKWTDIETGRSIMKGLVPWPEAREDIKVIKPTNAKQRRRSTEAREEGDAGEGGSKATVKRNVGINELKRRDAVAKKLQKSQALPSSFGEDVRYAELTVFLKKDPQGIGLRIKNIDGRLVIRSFSDWFDNSRAMLKANDVILAVNNHDAKEVSFDKLVSVLQWKEPPNKEEKVPMSLTVVEDIVCLRIARPLLSSEGNGNDARPTLWGDSRPIRPRDRAAEIVVSSNGGGLTEPTAAATPSSRNVVLVSTSVAANISSSSSSSSSSSQQHASETAITHVRPAPVSISTNTAVTVPAPGKPVQKARIPLAPPGSRPKIAIRAPGSR